MRIPRLFATMAALALSASVAGAQDVTFDVNGTYLAGTSRSLLTAPGAPYLLDFTVPESVTLFSPANQPSHLAVPTLSGFYRFNGQTYPSTSGHISFDETTIGNQTNIDLSIPTGSIVFQAPQPGFESAFVKNSTRNGDTVKLTFLTGEENALPLTVGYLPNQGSGGFGESNATAVGKLSPVPEPSTWSLIAVCLISCGGWVLARRF